jgi:hypothetical protein
MTENPRKKTKTKAADTGVLGSLPATRRTRIGSERRAGAATAKAGATRAKASAGRRAAKQPTAAKTRPARPAGTRVPPPPHEPDGRRAPGPPRGTELVTTAVQAAGELAQIGLTVGSQLLRRAAGRFPRP